MHRGYIKLWRKIFDSGIQHEPMTFTMWVWILCHVTRKPLNYIARGQCIKLNPGELIVGRKKLSKELRISEQSVRTCLHHLETWGNITIKPTNRFSILNVINWELYQDSENQINQQINQEVTSNQPASNQQVTTKQEVKNIKKEKKEDKQQDLPTWIDKNIWVAFLEHRTKIKKPLTPSGEKLAIKKLSSLRTEGWDANEVIENIIVSGWQGIYPPSNNGGSHKQQIKKSGVQRTMEIFARREYERQQEEKTANRRDPVASDKLLPG